MVDKKIMDAIEGALKDHGVDWIMEEHGSSFDDVLEEIEFALSKVIK